MTKLTDEQLGKLSALMDVSVEEGIRGINFGIAVSWFFRVGSLVLAIWVLSHLWGPNDPQPMVERLGIHAAVAAVVLLLWLLTGSNIRKFRAFKSALEIRDE